MIDDPLAGPLEPATLQTRRRPAYRLIVLALVLFVGGMAFEGWRRSILGFGTVGIGTMIDPDPDRRAVRNYVLKYSNDPSSVGFIDWRGPVWRPGGFRDMPFSVGKPYDAMVGVTIRDRNAVGALILGHYIFFLNGSKVVGKYKKGDVNPFWWANAAELFEDEPSSD